MRKRTEILRSICVLLRRTVDETIGAKERGSRYAFAATALIEVNESRTPDSLPLKMFRALLAPSGPKRAAQAGRFSDRAEK